MKRKKLPVSSKHTSFFIIVSIFLFVFLLIGIVFGIFYEQKRASYKKVGEVVAQVTPKEDLTKRCGQIPDNLEIFHGHYTIIDGPEWSPDCRHIAWSLWHSGTSSPFERENSLKEQQTAEEGIYVYSDLTKKTNIALTPTTEVSNLVFEGWEDKDTITYSHAGTRMPSYGRGRGELEIN